MRVSTDLQRVQRVHAARWLLHPNEIELGRVGLHDRVGELWGMGWSAELPLCSMPIVTLIRVSYRDHLVGLMNWYHGRIGMTSLE